VGLRRDRGGDKIDHMYHPCVISAPCIIVGFQPSQHQVVLSKQQDWSSKLQLF
jgi:hypothetical protein